jgi:glycosyltransferase involved in cell wall biosynthesis
MRIFLGLTNIASMYGDLKQNFRDLGVEVYAVEKHISAIINNNDADFTIQKAKDRVPYFKPGRISVPLKSTWEKKVDKYIYKKALKECDVFIFFWDTFKPDYSDLEEIKKAGKTIITVFVGDDVRWFFAMKEEFEMYGLPTMEYDKSYDYSAKALNARLTYLRLAEKYSDFIFSRLDQAQLQLRPYYRWNMMVPIKKFKNNPEQRKEKPVVAHAPSNRAIKGTRLVLDAFDRLKKEGISFEPLLIENVPNQKAIEMYSDADIVIDQLFCPGTGKLATEALACGSIVMGHMAYNKYPQKNPADCPIIDVNPDNLYQELKELILNYEFRKEHALKSRPYVEKHLDVKSFCEKVISLVNKEKIEFDYTPTFFRNNFIPESGESIEIYNNWNLVVKNCNWYKQFVKPGERAGLVF